MTKIFTQSALLGFSHKKYLVNPAIVCSSTSAPISSRCASLPGRKTRPAARASPRPFCPLSLRSLRSLRFNRRRILSCALPFPCRLIFLDFRGRCIKDQPSSGGASGGARTKLCQDQTREADSLSGTFRKAVLCSLESGRRSVVVLLAQSKALCC